MMFAQSSSSVGTRFADLWLYSHVALSLWFFLRPGLRATAILARQGSKAAYFGELVGWALLAGASSAYVCSLAALVIMIR